MWREIEILRRNRKSLVLTIIGFVAFVAVGLILNGYSFGLGGVEDIIAANGTYLPYLTLLLIIIGVALIDQYTSETVSKISLGLLALSIILTLLPDYRIQGLLLSLASLSVLLATSIPSERLVRPYRSRISLIGSSIKILALCLALIWTLNMVVDLRVLVDLFGGIDSTLYISLLSYIGGGALESFGDSYLVYSVDEALKNAFITGFTSSLVAVILVYILDFLGLVADGWPPYLNNLIRILIINLVASIIFLMFSASKGVIRVSLEGRKELPEDIFVLSRNEEIDIGNNVSLLIEKGTILARFETEILKEKLAGMYIIGIGTYRLKTNGSRIVGSFDKGWVIYKTFDEFRSMWSKLDKRRASFEDTSRLGFSSLSEIQSYLMEEVERIKGEITSKSGFSHVKLPFIEIIETPKQDYVKIGPLLIIDDENSTLVKFGPFKILSDKEIGASFRAPSLSKFGRKKPLAYMTLNDSERGRVSVVIYDDRVELNSKSASIKAKKGEMEIKTEATTLKLSDNEVKVVTPSLVLKARKEKEAKIVLSSGPIIKAEADGSVKLVKGNKTIKAYDPGLAKRIIERIYSIGEHMVKGITKTDETEELEDLLRYIEQILDRD